MLSPKPDLSQHCIPLQHPHWATVTLAALLVGGILVSYLPQHIKILKRQSSEGLSPWWVLLGALSSIAAIGNIVTLPTSRADMLCCRELAGGPCAAALLGVAQIAVQWACFMIIVVLFVAYAPCIPPESDDMSASALSITRTDPTKRRDPPLVGAIIFVSLLLVALVSLVLILAHPEYTQAWADILGTISGVLAAIQYVPQIYFTWKLKDLKSLSVITLLIQAPGAFVFALSLGLRVGWEGWSTWLVYIVTGLLQFVLLFMAINFWSVEKFRQRRAEISSTEGDDSDQTIQANGDNTTANVAVNERTTLLPKTNQRRKAHGGARRHS
ncbi:hypothetical protein AC578_3944 [Pseudocercospora eumusae]|uniref:PQ loop repeat protein n=1 Tax=Pseudocercospora eumusae TaxID=321146 RepID=A0A139HLJ4_9PEZI|nr:hypothetical protein AC578_3944 [Pseudocercospora eumusae]